MRKVALFTGNRAEYGLQYPIIKAIDAHPGLDYLLLVSGSHLDEDFSNSTTEIKKDGFRVDREVSIDMQDDTLLAMAQAIGSGIISISEALDELRPSILVVYGDRFESLAAVIAGTQMGIPTAHIEGGDITEGGALDDNVRHAMTKLAHLHFATNQEAAQRIIAMGEEPWRVTNVGLPAIDIISAGNFAKPAELFERYNLDINRPIVLFTQHSITTEFEAAETQITPTLEALEILAQDGVQIIVTYPNNDAGGKRIVDQIKHWSAAGIENVQIHSSLGRYNYHGVLHLAGHGRGRGVCVGNSSSGLKETPALGCPAVNIGSRQQGRLRAENVLDVGYNCSEILAAIKKSLYDDDFRSKCNNCHNPYGVGNSGNKIAEILANADLGPGLIQKKMTI